MLWRIKMNFQMRSKANEEPLATKLKRQKKIIKRTALRAGHLQVVAAQGTWH